MLLQKNKSTSVSSVLPVYLTIIPQARVGYEMIDRPDR